MSQNTAIRTPHRAHDEQRALVKQGSEHTGHNMLQLALGITYRSRGRS